MIIHNPILTGSFTVNGTDVASITSSAASITAINSYTASQNILNGTYATTGSNTFTGIQTVNSNLVVTGSITAQTLVVQTVTSSVVYSSGSNVFGNNIANTQVMTGSVTVTGSFRFGSSTQQTAGTERIYVGQNSAVGPDDANSLSLFVAHAPATGSPQIGLTYQFRTNDNAGGNLYGDAIRVIKNAGANSTYTVFTTNSTIGAGGERMRIDSSGNVGIGTTSPSYTLDVSGTGRYNGSATTMLSVISSGTASGLELKNTGGTASNWIIQSDGGAVAGQAALRFYSITASAYRMSIDGSGNVGIGTSSPLGRFNVFRAAGLSGTAAIVISSGESPSRNWSLNTDVVTDGDFAICVSTTTGGTPSPTSGNTKFYVTKNGNVAIGTTTIPSDSIGLIIGGTNSSLWRAYGSYSGNACGMDLSNGSNTTTVQFFGSSGNYYFAGSNISDRRSKTNIQAINSALSNLLQLKPSTFAYNLHPTIIKGGFIAQEVQEVLPDFVTVPEDETEMMGVDYNGILAMAVKAIQELQAQITELKNK